MEGALVFTISQGERVSVGRSSCGGRIHRQLRSAGSFETGVLDLLPGWELPSSGWARGLGRESRESRVGVRRGHNLSLDHARHVLAPHSFI